MDNQTLSSLVVCSEPGGESSKLQPGDVVLITEGRSADATAWTPFFTQPQLPVQNTQYTSQQQDECDKVTEMSA